MFYMFTLRTKEAEVVRVRVRTSAARGCGPARGQDGLAVERSVDQTLAQYAPVSPGAVLLLHVGVFAHGMILANGSSLLDDQINRDNDVLSAAHLLAQYGNWKQLGFSRPTKDRFRVRHFMLI